MQRGSPTYATAAARKTWRSSSSSGVASVRRAGAVSWKDASGTTCRALRHASRHWLEPHGRAGRIVTCPPVRLRLDDLQLAGAFHRSKCPGAQVRTVEVLCSEEREVLGLLDAEGAV